MATSSKQSTCAKINIALLFWKIKVMAMDYQNFDLNTK